VEQARIAAAFRFELSRFDPTHQRRTIVEMLRSASSPCGQRVAEELGMNTLPEAMPPRLETDTAGSHHVFSVVLAGEVTMWASRPEKWRC
jgi:hypothetical protein